MVWNGRYCVANPCYNGQLYDTINRKCTCPGGLQINPITNECQAITAPCDDPKIYS